MKILNELTGYKSTYDKTFEQVIKTLTDLYGVKVYSGNFGMVLAPEGKDYVYKLFHEDPAFEEYFKFCANNQHLSFVPKLKDKRIHKMKLPTIRDISHANAVIKIVKLPKLYKIENKDIAPFIKLDGQSEEWIPNFFRSAVTALTHKDRTSMEMYLTDKGMEFFDVLNNSGVFSLGFNNDLKMDNMMKDSSGNIIVTDPLWTLKGVKAIKNLEDTGETASYFPTDKIVTVFGKKGELEDSQNHTDAHNVAATVSDEQLALICKLELRDIAKLKDSQVYLILDTIFGMTGRKPIPENQMQFLSSLAVANRITFRKYISELNTSTYNNIHSQLVNAISPKLMKYIFTK